MKSYIALAVLLVVVVAEAKSTRQKRQAYQLPDGVEFLLGNIRTSFQCQQDGYYADVDNNCQIFHVCNTANHADGTSEILQYSFVCGNQTVFNQLTFTCSFPEDAVPCNNAPDFFYLNAKIGRENEYFHEPADLQRAAPLIQSNRGGYAPTRG